MKSIHQCRYIKQEITYKIYLEIFIIKCKHLFSYDKHIYIINDQVKKYINNNHINKEKLTNNDIFENLFYL